MTHEKKIEWMAVWAAKHGLMLVLTGECGFGRDCVGISVHDTYPDYEWHDAKTFERIDSNGEVWTPADAYHKHPCVAVLGRGRKAEAQLYTWLRWFDKNGFELEVTDSGKNDLMSLILGKSQHVRLVRRGKG